eukprot:TRINITY_DN12607_c0_g1_i1.p1 TRINITY_DN12607_c0_g1~~TRINITY_DN12607_c0_g1_i1.p1  ORF type:complete len:315 (+),score=53.74 TRINITY_DN12607_c0_g1_i1:84-1028(+)
MSLRVRRLQLKTFLLTASVWLSTARSEIELWRGSSESHNATELLEVARNITKHAPNAIFSTHALPSSAVPTSFADINSRVVSPRPLDTVSSPSSLGVVYIDTNNLSRKYAEIQSQLKLGAARINLLHFDANGGGYVSIRGNATICSSAEARSAWWEEGWRPFYPKGPDTPDYAVIRVDIDWLELVSARYNILSGRADWAPVSLHRVNGVWKVEVPANPSPSPTPSPPAPSPPGPSPPSSETWQCSVCQHIYDPVKDGSGKAFEDLPSDWNCPVCGADKSAFKKKKLADGTQQWVHDHGSKASNDALSSEESFQI